MGDRASLRITFLTEHKPLILRALDLEDEWLRAEDNGDGTLSAGVEECCNYGDTSFGDFLKKQGVPFDGWVSSGSSYGPQSIACDGEEFVAIDCDQESGKVIGSLVDDDGTITLTGYDKYLRVRKRALEVLKQRATAPPPAKEVVFKALALDWLETVNAEYLAEKLAMLGVDRKQLGEMFNEE